MSGDSLLLLEDWFAHHWAAEVLMYTFFAFQRQLELSLCNLRVESRELFFLRASNYIFLKIDDNIIDLEPKSKM